MQAGKTPQIQDYYSNVDLPSVEDMQVQLQQLVQQGVITPEDASAALQQRSAMNDIQTDPNLKQNQAQALASLQQIANNGGMLDVDKANLTKIRADEDTAAQGKRDAIIQNANARGVGGSGIELLSQMQNQQDSATRASQRDMDVSAQAQQRALDALIQQGTLSTQYQNQDFNQKAQTAQANDAISKFNAQNQQQVNLTNQAADNNAQQTNLAAKQNVADSNAALENQQQLYNKQLLQQQYQNKLNKANGQSGVASTNAANTGANSTAAANATNNTIGTALTTGSILAMSDERQKENIEEFNPSDFLDSITGYKYTYKKPAKYGQGKQVGVMAQDLEKTDAGSKLVIDTPEGKMIDYSKSGPAVLASLASINDRLKKIEGK